MSSVSWALCPWYRVTVPSYHSRILVLNLGTVSKTKTWKKKIYIYCSIKPRSSILHRSPVIHTHIRPSSPLKKNNKPERKLVWNELELPGEKSSNSNTSQKHRKLKLSAPDHCSGEIAPYRGRFIHRWRVTSTDLNAAPLTPNLLHVQVPQSPHRWLDNYPG